MTIIVKPKAYDGTPLPCDTYLYLYTAIKNVKTARAK